MAGLRVVLDTNVLVSGLAYPGSIPGRIVSAWRHGGINVVLSRYILNELARALPKMPRLQLSSDDICDLIDNFMFQVDIVEPDNTLDEHLRDPKDQAVLATLRVAKAHYLITGDKDLLALAETYPIVSPAVFWARHGG